MKLSPLIFTAATVAGLVLPRFTQGREVAIELPPESAAYKSKEGVQLAQSFCVQCHSSDYTEIQPPMPAKFWDAEVKKMRDKYGAPLPPEMDAKLVEYLVSAYGAQK